MKRLQIVRSRELAKALRNQDGFLLVAALVLMATLTLLGTTAYLLSSTDIKVGASFKTSQEALQVAEAGAERGRQILRQVNGAQTYGADPTAFNSELIYYAGGSRNLTSGTIGNYTYTVTLSNDSGDVGGTTADSNNKVLITSTATGPNNSKAVVEKAVSLPPTSTTPPVSLPASPGTISLLGNSASFIGGNSNAKSLNGDDQCSTVTNGLPVVAASAAGSVTSVKSSIASSKPATYHTKVDGKSVDASSNPDAIVKAITEAQMTSNGIDLSSATSLNSLVSTISALPQATNFSGNGHNSSNVSLGTVASPKIVVVDGDFTVNSTNNSGAGILVVTGTLTFSGNINYTGIIMVVGEGNMQRNGGGNGTISGAVWIANTQGPNDASGNPTMGAARLDTSGGGNSNIQYCSSAVSNAINLTSVTTYPALTVKSARQVL